MSIAKAAFVAAHANQLWIPAQMFTAIVGSPGVANIASRAGALSFDDAAAEYAATVLRLPTHWRTIDIDFYWAPVAAEPSGNVSWIVDCKEYVDGDSINQTPANLGNNIAAAPTTQYALKVTTVATNGAITPSKLTLLRVGRNGASGNDTLTGDAALFGILLRKA